MCCGDMFFNPFQAIIMSLEPGDEVIVTGIDHEGNKHVDEKVIVYELSHYSFLSTSGFGFGAGVITDLVITGKKVEKPIASEKALRVLAAIESKKLAKASGFVGTGELENFDVTPE
jgi:hypothetical protein